MQLSRAIAAAALVGATLCPALARAEDRVDTTVSWMSERRVTGGSLQIIHPQFDFGVDLGENVSLSAGYEADVVSGATQAIYSAPMGVDAVTGATTFSDTRHSGRAGLSFQGRRSRLFGGFTYGTERDYRTSAITVGGTIDFPGKNQTVGLSYTHNFDSVCDLDNGDATPLDRRPLTGENECFVAEDTMGRTTVTRDVSIDSTEATFTQIVSPTMVMQFGVHGQLILGFQSNPYRRVRVGEVEAQERVPDQRARLAIFWRTNIAFPKAHGALGASVRGYTDTWGVNSLTAEMTYHQYLGSKVLFRLRTRAYQQTEAVFFEDATEYANFGSNGEFFTGDRELSPLRHLLFGGKMSFLAASGDAGPVWGLFDEIDFHVRTDVIYAQSLTETAPGGDTTGVLPDVIVVSLGLLMRY